METKQIVQSSANVIRITNVKPGDVYKRFDESYDDRTYFGVIQAVHNDGDKTIIESMEYCYRYSSLEVNHKVLRGEKDYILFPSSPEELNLDLEKAKKNKINEIEEYKEKISKSEKELEHINGIISGETLKKLSAMSYKELTQEQFNQKKLEAGI